MKSRALVLAGALVCVLVLAAEPAAAEPSFGRTSSAVVKGRRLDIVTDALLDGPGDLTAEGTVNGRPFSSFKRIRAGGKTVKFKIDAKKLGFRKLDRGLTFDFELTLRETGGASASRSVGAFVPLPCVYLPGFGNEATPGGAALFAVALNSAADGIYTTEGKRPTLLAHEYPSLSQSLSGLGGGLAKTVKKALKGTVFGKVDVVGYSYGGIVARSFMARGGGASVRRCVFLATPNKGVPIAYAAVGLLESGQLDQILGGNPALADLAGQLLSAESRDAIRNLYPTYPWVMPDNFLTRALLATFLGDPATPLTELNATAPHPGVTFDAFFYTSTGVGQFGTVDLVDVSVLTSGAQIDPAAIATGSGDGLAPAHSVRMDGVPGWGNVITPHDMGVGTHVTILSDANVIAGVAAILTQ